MQTIAYELNYQYETCNWWFLGRQKIIHTFLASLMENFPVPPKILDFGCGTGRLTQSLETFGVVTGVDFSEEAIHFCQKRGMNNISKISHSREIASESFDFIVSFDVMEHLDDDDALLLDFNRILKPRGFLFITVPALPILWGGEDIVSQHKRRYKKRELLGKLSNFEIHKLSYFNTLLFPFIAFIRIGNRLFRPATLQRSDISELNETINTLFYKIFGWEATLLKFMNLPIGVSLLAIARKKCSQSESAFSFVS